MAYHPLWVIQLQIYAYRKTTMVVFYPSLGGGEEKSVHTFPKCIRRKINVLAWLEFELAHFKNVVLHFSRYTTGTPTVFDDRPTQRLCVVQGLFMVCPSAGP